MATRKPALVHKNAHLQRRESLFASRSRLLARIGPPVFEAAANKAGMIVLLRRYDLMSLVRRGHWPKPITAQVNKLIMDGVKSPSTPEESERFADMCHALVLASAVVPPPELEALGGPPEGQGPVPIYGSEPADTLEAKLTENAKRGEALEAERAAYRKAIRTAMESVDPESLRPLFVERGEEPDDDQLVLVKQGDEEPPNPAKGEIQLHINDLVSLATAITQFQTGAMHQFLGE